MSMSTERMCKNGGIAQRGMTLLEVLVALLVLSIGLMGLAGLQGTSLHMNNSAYQRSQATALAYDIADRVRANVDAGNAYHLLGNGAGTDNTDTCEGEAGCPPAQMAANDIYRWKEAIAEEFKGESDGLICLDSTPDSLACDGSGDTYVVRVAWDDNRDGDVDLSDRKETIIVSFRP